MTPIDPHGPDPQTYDRVLVAYSGGKDCTAVLLQLLQLGVNPARIELHHHDVDGDGPAFMDWPCTLSYCRTIAAHFGLRLYRSYREGGFWREMHRDRAATAAVCFEDPAGGLRRVGGASASLGTRLRFPQVTGDLRRRWCSPVLKIDVMDALIRNQARFAEGRTLVCTGERAAESPGRSRYAAFEPHRSDLRHGLRGARHIDHWRPVHSWSEDRVWTLIRAHGVVPHVAYQLGWSRLSCMACVFISADLWATIALFFPERFELIAEREEAFGCTVQRHASVRDLARSGRPLAAALERPDLVAQAQRAEWTLPIHVPPHAWSLPAGAYGRGAGPT